MLTVQYMHLLRLHLSAEIRLRAPSFDKASMPYYRVSPGGRDLPVACSGFVQQNTAGSRCWRPRWCGWYGSSPMLLFCMCCDAATSGPGSGRLSGLPSFGLVVSFMAPW